jgi:hypothetical protein
MPWRPSYPFLRSAAYDDDPAYLRRWGPYLDHITECGYEDSLVEAKEERRRALRDSARGPALLRLRLHTGHVQVPPRRWAPSWLPRICLARCLISA